MTRITTQCPSLKRANHPTAGEMPSHQIMIQLTCEEYISIRMISKAVGKPRFTQIRLGGEKLDNRV